MTQTITRLRGSRRRTVGPRELIGTRRPPVWLGLLAALLAAAVATALIYPLAALAPVVSLSVVYLPGVLLVSVLWGLPLGLLASVTSAAAFNFFHIPPVGRFTIADSRNWVALGAFVLVAAVVSTIAELARSRAAEVDRRRVEADLGAALARELLQGESTRAALAPGARRLAEGLGLPSAAIRLGASGETGSQRGLALRDAHGEPIATLLVPRTLPADTLERLRSRIVPQLEGLLAIALERDAAEAEAIETAALRRSDELKTALLRSLSHDLRTPITAIVTAAHALGVSSLEEAERGELTEAVLGEAWRLTRLIDKLLDLSRLQAGRAEPRSDWVDIEDLLHAARDGLGGDAVSVRVRVDHDVPEVHADLAQLERAFANLLENAVRYSEGRPVSAHARRAGDRVVVEVVDQGPGISRADQARIFEPFYRGAHAGQREPSGSGLGLAIAKGFVEANRGRIRVESLPGQGTSFAVDLPVPSETPAQSAEAVGP